MVAYSTTSTYGGYDLHTILPHIIGGAIISAGITLNLWSNDKFTSLTSLVTSFVGGESADTGRKGAFVAGLVIASTLVWNINGYGPFNNTSVVPFETEAAFTSGLGLYGFIISGLLVGLGSSIAGGGLSRFAFCGIPSLSIKSFIAVGAFLGAGFLAATTKNNFTFLTANSMSCALLNVNPRLTVNIFTIFAIVVVVLAVLGAPSQFFNTALFFAAGAVVSLGYMVSGLSHRFRVLHFLTFQSGWSPHLLFSLAAVIGVNFLTFNVILGKNLRAADANTNLINVLVGSGIFGLGLGLSGLTAGTALVVAPVYFPEVLVFFLIPVVFGHQLSGSVTKVLAIIGAAHERSESYALF